MDDKNRTHVSERPAFPQSSQTWKVRQLLGLVASVTAQDEQGKTALVAAAYQDSLSITDLLIPL